MINQLTNISSKFAFELIDLLSMPAHIKDAKTKQYLTCNQLNLEIYGATKIEQIVGKTVTLLDNNMKNYWGNIFAKQVEEMDKVVVSQQKTVVDTRSILTVDGMLRLQRMVKLPLVNNNKTLAIFTYSENLAHTLNIKSLYAEYRKFYSKKLAVKQFLQHLNLVQYFNVLPTDAELNVLIEKVTTSRNKDLSQALHLAEKTIETHSLSLRNKLNKVDIFTLLSIMRNIDFN